MKVVGVVGIVDIVACKFSNEGQQVLTTTGVKVSGKAEEFARYDVAIPDGATAEVKCEAFITLAKAKNILMQGGKLTGFILDNGMKWARNVHGYDYPLYISNYKQSVPYSEFQALVESKADLNSLGIYKAIKMPNDVVMLYDTPSLSPVDYSLTLKAQIVEDNKGEDEVTGYMVSFDNTNAQYPMEFAAIAKNADIISPNNFIVKKSGDSYVFSAKPGTTLKDLPVVKWGEKAQVGKAPKTASTSSGDKKVVIPGANVVPGSDVDLEHVCEVMSKYNAEWLKWSGNKGAYKVKSTEEHEFDILGIDIASPKIRYSMTTLNANVVFKKLATTRVDYDNGHMFEEVNCYTIVNRSLFDSKGVKAVENMYMICPNHVALNLILDLKDSCNLDLQIAKSKRFNVPLSYINSGVLERDDYVILEGDLTHVKTTTAAKNTWISNCNIRSLIAQLQRYKGERTYLKKQRDALKAAIDGNQDVTGIKLPERPVCKAYANYEQELKNEMENCGIDLSYGSFLVKEKEETKTFVPPINYSIPRVPLLGSKDFSKTLAEAKASVLSDKNVLKKEVYTPLFVSLDNFVVTLANTNDDLAKLNFIESRLKSVGEQIDKCTMFLWYYNQWAVSGIEVDDGYIFDNGASEIVGAVANKIECTVPNSGDVHNKYLITIDLTKVKFADAQQRSKALSEGKFSSSIYAQTAQSYDVIKNQSK